MSREGNAAAYRIVADLWNQTAPDGRQAEKQGHLCPPKENHRRIGDALGERSRREERDAHAESHTGAS